MLHTLYGNSLKYDANFFIEYFALELLRSNTTNACVGALVYNIEDGTYHKYNKNATYVSRAFLGFALLN